MEKLQEAKSLCEEYIALTTSVPELVKVEAVKVEKKVSAPKSSYSLYDAEKDCLELVKKAKQDSYKPLDMDMLSSLSAQSLTDARKKMDMVYQGYDQGSLLLAQLEALKKREAELDEIISTQAKRQRAYMQKKFKEELVLLRAGHEQEMASLKNKVELLTEKSSLLDTDRLIRVQYEGKTRDLLRMNTKLESLRRKIDSSTGFINEWETMATEVSKTHPILRSALDAIPNSVIEKGVKNQKNVINDFNSVERSIRRSIFINGAKTNSYTDLIKAEALYWLSLRETELREPSNEFARLARADHYIRRGDLLSGIHEIEKLPFESRKHAKKWIQEAKTFITVQQSMKLMSSRLALMGKN